MDVATCLQQFENRLSSLSEDDPLDCWDKFVEFLEQRLPADGRDGMSMVFDRLVQSFLNTERYKNDVRYVNYCIRCASYYSDPVALYSHVYSKGIGTRTAALYVAWAQQFEQRGFNEQAEAVYQRAMENQAQPEDAIINEYRQFQSRTKSQTPASAGARNPLQNSHLTNQMLSHKEPVAPNKSPVDGPVKPPAYRTVITVSRSETSGTIPPSQTSSVQMVSEYNKDELVCEGSELCFEEVRAERYFSQLREKHADPEMSMRDDTLRRMEEMGHAGFVCVSETFLRRVTPEESSSSKDLPKRPPAAEAATNLNPNPTQNPFGRPRPPPSLSSRRSLGLRLHVDPDLSHKATPVPEAPQQSSTEAAEVLALSSAASPLPSVLSDRHSHVPQASMVQPDEVEQVNQSLHRLSCVSAVKGEGEQPSSSEDHQPQEINTTHHDMGHPPEPEENLNMSQGGTANLSHITPNTSLGFAQATPSRVLPSPTVNTREALDVIMDMFQAPPFGNASMLHAAEREADPGYMRSGGASSFSKPAASAAFTIFQDNNDKENGCAAAAAPVAQKIKPVRALAEIPVSKLQDTPPDLMPDESTMWGARYNSLNSLAACPNSTTDFAMLAQFVSTPFTHKTPVNGNFFQDEENPCDGEDAGEEGFLRRQTKKLSPIIEQSPVNETLSETAVSKLAPSSERQGTIVGEGLASAPLCVTASSTTMVQPPPPAVLSFRDQTLCPTETSSVSRTTGPTWEVYTSPERPPKQSPAEPFTIIEDLETPSSPERVQEQVYDVPMSPGEALKSDWLNIKSPEAAAAPEPDLDAFLSPRHHNKNVDIPMSPEWVPPCADVPMSPGVQHEDEVMMSPDRGARADMLEKTGLLQLVSDPWDNDLISHLLSSLNPPLTSHPHCISWQFNVPKISPKMTISMGKASLDVECVLGEGAYATVYQAKDPRTSEKVILKVQKPANPWEFYINTQLDARLQPSVRHLYSSLRSAHLFSNGSVLLGELHNYGTLLNTVNIYKTLSDKVMPQPLVMYLTVCILNMVEKLHAIHIVHADIKPDNFLLGERFLDNKCFDSENVNHGLALVDLGQSIDMQLFPRGTAFTGKCLTSGFQCTEMLNGKPWNYQTDYFGIAGTVHCMLFGTYMQVTNDGGVWKTNGVFRRNPHSDLWQEFFHTLLNVPDCGSLPSLHSLRCKLSEVLQQNYSRKLPTLKTRLVVLLLENHKPAR